MQIPRQLTYKTHKKKDVNFPIQLTNLQFINFGIDVVHFQHLVFNEWNGLFQDL